MRALLDTNVLISYLLSPDTERTVTSVVRVCLQGPVELTVPQELLVELLQTVQNKEYLRQRITQEEVTLLAQQMIGVGNVQEPLEPATYSRDVTDDYLVAHGLVGGVDYLVTGDPDLLVLGQVETLRIVNPARFVEILTADGIL